MTDDGLQLLLLIVRIVEGQIDDILVSAPDCDFLGWDRQTDPQSFLLHTVGISVLRETPSINVRQTLIQCMAD